MFPNMRRHNCRITQKEQIVSHIVFLVSVRLPYSPPFQTERGFPGIQDCKEEKYNSVQCLIFMGRSIFKVYEDSQLKREKKKNAKVSWHSEQSESFVVVFQSLSHV